MGGVTSPRNGFATLVVGLLATVGTPSLAADEIPLQSFNYERPKMGTIVRVTVYSRDETLANDAARAAYARASELNAILSDYEPESELNRLCRNSGPGTATRVSAELFDVLERSQRLAKASDGAFDVTVGPVTKLWRKARRSKSLPDEEDLAAARMLVGWENVVLDVEARSVELKKPGMQLDLGGIAKGYVADAMLAVLREKGCPMSMIDAGGDLAIGDPRHPPIPARPWHVLLGPVGPETLPHVKRYPRMFIRHARGVATSGDLYQYLEVDGVRYSHIVDPRTGLGLIDRSTVTVVAPDSVTADAYASAISVLGPSRGLELAKRTEGVEVLIRFVEEGKLQQFSTRGFRRLQRPPMRTGKRKI